MGSKWEPAASADLSVRSLASLPHDIRVVPHFWIPMRDGEWAERPGNTIVRACLCALSLPSSCKYCTCRCRNASRRADVAAFIGRAGPRASSSRVYSVSQERLHCPA